ncbi:MAG: ATP-binding cassette domain-containing protein [Cyanobacteria bacterium P01_A01_bin.45]|mgnify:CR=1 FL=1
MSQIAVQVEEVTVSYNGKVALHGANLELRTGSISGLVGMNGSGKSTLFKAIMGFVQPTHGRVLIKGISMKRAQKQNLVAYIPQYEDVDWNFPISVEDVVMMGRYGYMNFLRIPGKNDHEIVTESLLKTHMNEFRSRQIGELSGGQKKRAFLARALAQKAQVILLDEPFAGVDIKTEKAIIQLLVELRNMGHTILISTHDLSSISTFCDDVVLINGTILAYGPTREVFTEENIARTFDGMMMIKDVASR